MLLYVIKEKVPKSIDKTHLRRFNKLQKLDPALESILIVEYNVTF